MKNIIFWMVGGVALVSIVFFIPDQSAGIWPSVLWGTVAALLYTVVFSIRWLKEISASKKRVTFGVMLSVLVICSGIFATISYNNSQRQEKVLTDIRSFIEENIAYSHIRGPLSKTLRAYYADEDGTGEIGELFISRYDSLITSEGRYLYSGSSGDQTLQIYLAESTADSVVLIGESSYLEGTDSSFENFSGEKGQYQVKGILTEQGVVYEQSN